MSVCNIMFAPDRVLILSDTMSYTAEGKPLALSAGKTHVAPAGSFAWTNRGRVDLGADLTRRLQAAADIVEAEALAEAYMRALAEGEGTEGGPERQEVTLAGWSAVHNDLRVVRLSRGRSGFNATVLERGIHLLPTPDLPPNMPKTCTEAQFLRLALAQWRTRDHFPNLCIGGVQILCEVTAAGVEMRIAGLYPDYDQHAADLGDPNAWLVELWRCEQAEAVAA